MRPCIRITDHVSVCGVLISSGRMSTKTAVPVVQAFSYYISTETELVWELTWPTLHPRTMFHGCLIVYRDPLNVKTSCPKNKPRWAMCKCIVFMSNPNAILKNWTVPTNAFISQHLLILDY